MKALELLARELAREQDALLVSAQRRQQVRARFLREGDAQQRAARRRPARVVFFVAAAFAASLCVVVGWRWSKKDAGSVQVGRGELSASAGTWLHASESEPLPLSFADGTRIEMAPRARARVLVLEPKETRLLLESGRAHVEVARRSGQNFSISTGPFNVHVTGTRFDVSWDAEHDQFELTLAEGQVELSGCVFGAGKKLVAGQRVAASCKVPRLDVAYSTATAAPSASAPPVSDESTSEAAPPSTHSGAEPVRARKGSVQAGSGWLELAHAGRYADAFALAEREGFAELCQRTNPAELALLGESARHGGQLAEARQAFTTLRRRFPAAKEAALAAFSLGLLEFDGFAAYAKAAEWFRAYLRENPRGPLARDARGRLMEAEQRSGNRAEARELAANYLAEYPTGPHAELARRIASSP